MRIVNTPVEFKEIRKSLRGSVGFVPTMGALHAGHASLLQMARRKDDTTVLSIFVNPTQFNNAEDLQKYPRTLDSDIEIAKDCGVDYLFLPIEKDLYPDGYRYRMTENEISKVLCGAFRPGHFDGVLTVVLKLLNIVEATRAYFGEKDFQQLELIRGMSKSFFMSTEIIGCPTIREASGLAMSSRNVRLSADGLQKAKEIPELLSRSKTASDALAALAGAGFKVEYVEDRWNRRLTAVYLEGVRLIDNVELEIK